MGSITKQDYQDAILSQSACNLSGIVHAMSRVMDRIWEEARENGQGTDWVNSHPICRLYAEQISHLTCTADWFQSHQICKEKAQ